MRIKPNTYFLIFLLVIGIIFVIYSSIFQPLQAKLTGIIIGLAFIVLGVIQLLKEIAVERKPVYQDTKEQLQGGVGTRVFLRRSAILSVWVVGFVTITYLLGFLLAVPIFIFSYLKLHATGWLTALAVSVLTTAVVIGIFELFLSRSLWGGLIFSM